MTSVLVPPNGVAYILTCPHECALIFRPGDDPYNYELTSGYRMIMEYGPVAAKCSINQEFYFAHTAWSIL